MTDNRSALQIRRDVIARKAVQHTPGPWTAKKHNSGSVEITHESQERHSLVAVLPGSGLQQGSIDENARLIASAPDILAERDRLRALNAELLAALVQCEDLLSELADGGAENPELEIARAAIAKAKGEAP